MVVFTNSKYVKFTNTHLRVGAHCLHFSKATCLRGNLADTSFFVIGDLQKNAVFCIIFRCFAGIFSPTSHGTSHENSHKTSHEPIWVYLALCIFVVFVRFPGALYPIAKQLYSKTIATSHKTPSVQTILRLNRSILFFTTEYSFFRPIFRP